MRGGRGASVLKTRTTQRKKSPLTLLEGARAGGGGGWHPVKRQRMAFYWGRGRAEGWSATASLGVFRYRMVMRLTRCNYGGGERGGSGGGGRR